METIESFCDRHGACLDGKKWALDNCATMRDVWERAKPEWLVWVATRRGVVDDKTLRLFACWCVRQVWHLLKDERSRNAVLTAEKYTRGSASEDELSTAWETARAAVSDATDAERSVGHATRAAMWVAWDDAAESSCYAAGEAASAASREDLRTTSRADSRFAELDDTWAPVLASLLDLARDATRASARSAARSAARKDQAKWFRENAKPNFEVVLKKSEAAK